MSIDNFMKKFGGNSDVRSFSFYNGEVTLWYSDKEHCYFLVNAAGENEYQDGVTSICHIIDKSAMLIPWAAKMTVEKLLRTVPTLDCSDGKWVKLPRDQFEQLAMAAKSGHKERLEDAAHVGHTAHNWIESHINAELQGKLQPAKPSESRANSCCEASLGWMQKHNVRWISTERKVFSRTHGFAGTMDGLATVDSCDDPNCCPVLFTNRLSIIDWKSSNHLQTEYLLQTAAYQGALQEETKQVIEDRWIIRLGKEDGEVEPWHITAEHFERDWQGFLTCLKLSRLMRNLKQTLKDKREKDSAVRSAIKSAERVVRLNKECLKHRDYKGVRKPSCGELGDGCDACKAKYTALHIEI